jgi:parallel beta-helix repeat protein
MNMRYSNRHRLLFAVVLVAIYAAGFDGVIPYQGKLTNLSGAGVNDTLSMRFSLFDSETGGDTLWSEVQPSVPIVLGLFDVELGSIATFDLPFDERYWLDISVDGNSLSPRVPLGISPYAFRAKIADSVAVSVGDGWSISGEDMFSNVSGNVGIGTVSPEFKLHVVGDAYIDGNIKLRGTHYDPEPDSLLSVVNGIVHLTKFPFVDRNGTALTVSILPDSSGNFVCDGIADQVEIEAAIDSLASIGGGRVFIKPGEYHLMGAIDINDSYISLEGAGPSTFLMTDPAVIDNAINVAGSPSAYIEGVSLSDLRISTTEGTGCGGDGIYFYMVQFSEIRSCWLGNCNDDAMMIESSSNNIISSNRITDSDGEGINLMFSNSNIIEGNMISGNTSSGIYLDQSGSNVINGNVSIDNTMNGVSLVASQHNAINGNIFATNGTFGVYLYQSSNNAIDGNIIRHNSQLNWNLYDGIELLYYSSHNIISDNDIYGSCQKYGIEICASTCSGNIVEGNMLYHNSAPYNDLGADTRDWGPGNSPSTDNIDNGANYW